MTRLQADLLLIGVAMIWGSAFVAQNLGMADVGPFTFTGIRFLLGALLILPLVVYERRSEHAQRGTHTIDRHDFLRIIVLGLMVFLGAALQQIGIVTTTVTNAGFLTALYVPLVPLLSLLVFKESPHWIIWPSSLGCLAGTWFLTGGQSLAINSGDLWVIASALFWAGHVLLVGHSSSHGTGPYTVAFGQFVVVGVLGCAVALIIETPSWAGIEAAAGAIAYAGFVSVGIGYTGQVVGQRHTPAADTAIILSLETVFAALFGAWWLGESLVLSGWIGCGLIFSSIIAVQLAPLWRSRRTQGA